LDYTAGKMVKSKRDESEKVEPFRGSTLLAFHVDTFYLNTRRGPDGSSRGRSSRCWRCRRVRSARR